MGYDGMMKRRRFIMLLGLLLLVSLIAVVVFPPSTRPYIRLGVRSASLGFRQPLGDYGECYEGIELSLANGIHRDGACMTYPQLPQP